MRVLIINPPHPAIGSRIPDDHLPPLGLLCIGGPLLDAGHDVELLDAEFGPMSIAQVVAHIAARAPDLLLIGHSGSTSVHPIALDIAARAKRAVPDLRVIYGGVFPTYHWRDILRDAPQIDIVVRGEGEATTRELVDTLEAGKSLNAVDGIAYREGARIVSTPQRTLIEDLDAYRIGWELIDFRRYSYWGCKRAVVVQFSRGCPHPCTYCGQRGFWTKWRCRNPERFAVEIARLHREHGVEVFNFADENPTSSRSMWKRFLLALIAENVNVTLVGSTRAGDIVRDRDILHLYKQAGVERFLMGMENPDQDVLDKIRKGSSNSIDAQAIRLMRQHGMLSLATWVVGFEEERDADYWRGLKQLVAYDPDQIQMLYVTPHRWTPFFAEAAHRRVIQLDQTKWDYKHQVLATRHVPPWRVFLWVKGMELVMQARPRALLRLFTLAGARLRRAQRWYYQMGRRVWFHEVFGFFFGDKRVKHGPSVEQFWGAALAHEEDALARPAAPGRRQLLSRRAPTANV